MAEQYIIPKELDLETLRYCLDNFELDSIFIRLVGCLGGDTKVNEKLEGRTLDFRKDSSGLHWLIDGEKVFYSPLEDVGTREGQGFTVFYERFYDDGVQVMLSAGFNPNATNLPEPKRSFLRHVIDEHFIEIRFKGKIPLEFHSWLQEPHFAYWIVKKEDS